MLHTQPLSEEQLEDMTAEELQSYADLVESFQDS